jgi:hypothetical protein
MTKTSVSHPLVGSAREAVMLDASLHRTKARYVALKMTLYGCPDPKVQLLALAFVAVSFPCTGQLLLVCYTSEC